LNDLQNVVKNYPFKVNFAGLRGTTMSMQAAGWQLCVDSYRVENRHSMQYRISGRHPELRLRLLSGYFELSMGAIMEGHRAFESVEIPIAYCSEAITMVINSQPTAFRAVDFSNPLSMNVATQSMSLDDLCPFMPFNNEVDVYIPEKEIVNVNDYLFKILDSQADKQKELRAKKRAKRLKEEKAREGKPRLGLNGTENRDIKFQIISV